MSSISTPRPAAAPAKALATSNASALDPMRLLKKYKMAVVMAMVFGAGLGALGHILMAIYYPIYTAEAVFEFYPATTQADQSGIIVNKDEFAAFKATQLQTVKSEPVMSAVANDPRLATEASKWQRRYLENGAYNPAEATKDLRSDVSVRMLGESNYMTVSMKWTDKREVAGLVNLISQAYTRNRETTANSQDVERRSALSDSIKKYQDDITRLQSRRDGLLREFKVESLDEKIGEALRGMQVTGDQLNSTQNDLIALQVQIEERDRQLRSNQAIQYDDALKAEVERDPIIVALNNQIVGLQSDLKAALQKLAPTHRDVRELERQIEARQDQLRIKREEILDQRFNAMVETLRQGREQLQASIADLGKRLEEFKKRANELTGVQSQIRDIDMEVERQTLAMTETDNKLKNLVSIAGINNAVARVNVFQAPRIPNETTFPKWYIMIPAGLVLVTGAVCGLIVLRELVDQRVKGPSDIALIPKTRCVGIIPHASEDPGNPKTIETVFRDQPSGVLAESFRQLRGSLGKRLEQGGHRTLMVVAGMPASGATSVVCNIAMAFAAAEERVLVIDANFRRPRVHAALGMQESPGLADILKGEASLASAIVKTGDGRLDVLPAGSGANRRHEALTADAMTAVLREASGRYDLVLIDVAPALVSGDAIGLANRCDAALLVVKAMGETRGMVNRIRNELSETRADFLGVIVNGVRSAAGGYLRGNIKATHNYQNTKD